jgi:hypothetical protein
MSGPKLLVANTHHLETPVILMKSASCGVSAPLVSYDARPNARSVVIQMKPSL